MATASQTRQPMKRGRSGIQPALASALNECSTAGGDALCAHDLSVALKLRGAPTHEARASDVPVHSFSSAVPKLPDAPTREDCASDGPQKQQARRLPMPQGLAPEVWAAELAAERAAPAVREGGAKALLLAVEEGLELRLSDAASGYKHVTIDRPDKRLHASWPK